MNLVKKTWSCQDYQEYLEYLETLKEEKYQVFNQKLIFTKYQILGIRMPIQRKIAQEIKQGNYQEFLLLCSSTYFEEINIEGFVLGLIKDKEELLAYLDPFISKIDNWATCDSFCNSLKIIKKDPETFWFLIENYFQSKEEFTGRVGLVLLLTYYVNKEYLPRIFSLINTLQREEYYFNMALSWLISTCYIKEKELTLPFLIHNKISSFPYNKAISKICDSYRVSKEEKEKLKKLRK